MAQTMHKPLRRSKKGILLRLFLGRRRREEGGQVMPLAAIGLFIMALGIMATLNLGQAVNEKIRLQNTADSAAYSLAAAEARTFNYIAFLNRAQIAHYNTAMVVNSIITWVGYHVALYGTAVNLIQALNNAWIGGTIAIDGRPPPYVPYAATQAAIQALVQSADSTLSGAIQTLHQADDEAHKFVEAMSIFNRDAVWQTQAARALMLNVHLVTGGQQYIEALDPSLSFANGGSSVAINASINAALNSLEYYQAFDNASGMNASFIAAIVDYAQRIKGGTYADRGDDEAKDAHALMTEMANAARFPKFVSNRGGATLAYATQGAAYSIVIGNKKGQTKITSGYEMDGSKIKGIRDEENHEVGRSISSDDYFDSGMGISFAVMGPAVGAALYTPRGNALGDAVAAYGDDGKHIYYDGAGGNTTGTNYSPGGGAEVITVPLPQGSGQDTMEEKEDAPWAGFAPYFKFNANKDRTKDYNQPSTWIFLNKNHKLFQSGDTDHGNRPWQMNFSWKNGDQEASLDTTVGGSRNSYFLEGLSVISRGMAYYHRPGAWAEQPNFFNPFWRARLAPVGQKLQALFDRYVTSNMTHEGNGSSGDAVLSVLLNVLRGASMDMFTTFITSLITH